MCEILKMQCSSLQKDLKTTIEKRLSRAAEGLAR